MKFDFYGSFWLEAKSPVTRQRDSEFLELAYKIKIKNTKVSEVFKVVPYTSGKIWSARLIQLLVD